MKTFGEELLHFAQSADYLSQGNLAAIRDTVFTQLRSRIGAATVEVCLETRILGEHTNVGLEYEWFSGGFSPAGHNLFDAQKHYYGQTSFAYDRNVNLWIVGKEDVPLHEADEYLDLWGHSGKEIPKFIPYAGNREIRTSIIMPLLRSAKPRGVFNLEFETRVEMSDLLRDELLQIKQAIEILVELGHASEENKQNTIKAIERLKSLPVSPPHTYFISYSGAGAGAGIADHIEVLLQRKGRRVLRDEESIDAGAVLSDRVQAMISSCDTFLFVCSEESTQSAWCMSEIQAALNSGRRGRRPKRIVVVEGDRSAVPMLLNTRLRKKGQDRDIRVQSVRQIMEEEIHA